MSTETKEIIKTVGQGHLPPLSQTTKETTTSSTNGTQDSQRGLDKTTFGLQNLNEGLEVKRNSNDNKK